MTRLSLRNVNKKCPNNDMVVKNFSLDIEDKEFVVLAGPAGCGKTLLIRMIAGLEESNSGEIYIDGELVNDKETKDRGVAMIFANYALYPQMSVYDNIVFALRLARLSQEEIEKRVGKIAEFMKIEELLSRMPEMLSEEETLQAVIARAIVKEPKVLLMDDPLIRITGEKKAFIEQRMAELRQKLDIPIVYATQGQEEAMTMASRIVILKEGEIQQEGAPKELYSYPANTFVARFLGMPPINMVEAEVAAKADGIVVRFGENEIGLPEDKSLLLRKMEFDGKKVFMGIRPEDVSVAAAGLSDGNVVEAAAEGYEEVDGRTFLCVNADDNSWMIENDGSEFRPNEMIKLALDTKKLHIFCAETGDKIC